MPGNMIGTLPSTTPRKIPTKIGIRFGSFSRRIELPSIFETALIADSLPTTVSRSPI